jgi:hypothetical protein
MLPALALVACGGMSFEHRPDESGGTEAQPVVFTRLPVDFRAQCPAQGCTLKLQSSNWSGLWSNCQLTKAEATFDPATYDFGARCADSTHDYSVPPSPSDENPVSFIDQGVEYEWWDHCTAQQVMLGPAGEMLTPSCWRDESETRLLELREQDLVSHEAADGSRYRYNVQQLSVGLQVKVNTLASADTSTMVDRCLQKPSWGALCDGPGISFPFGPSGVGPAPPVELTRSWLDCFWVPAFGTTDAEIVSACASALGALEVQDAAPRGQFYRFNAGGTVDLIGVSGSRTTCRLATVGAAVGHLSLFYCSIEPGNSLQSPLGTGLIGTATDPYEIRSIAGKDYLIWQRHADELGSYSPTEWYTIAVAQPLADDPCATAPLPACVLGEREP